MTCRPILAYSYLKSNILLKLPLFSYSITYYYWLFIIYYIIIDNTVHVMHVLLGSFSLIHRSFLSLPSLLHFRFTTTRSLDYPPFPLSLPSLPYLSLASPQAHIHPTEKLSLRFIYPWSQSSFSVPNISTLHRGVVNDILSRSCHHTRALSPNFSSIETCNAVIPHQVF